MADISISKFTTQVPRIGASPSTPGFSQSEGQDPVNPSGGGQNHAPVTIGSPANGLAISAGQELTLTHPVNSGELAFGTGSGGIGSDSSLAWDNTIKSLSLSNYSLTGSSSTPALSISGTWNTTGTPTAFLLNITDTSSNANSILMNLQVGGSNRFRFRKDGIFNFGGGGAIAQIRGNINESFDMRSPASGTSNDFIFQNGIIGSRNHTSGNVSGLLTNIGFSPTSGTGTYSAFSYTGIINQTGGANGITRGIYLIPTLTSAPNWRSFEWANNSGWGLYGSGTANNYLAGNLWIGTTSGTDTLDVNGTARIRTISNLGSTATRFLVASATGVISERTGAELASDIGATSLWTEVANGIYRNGRVVVGSTTVGTTYNFQVVGTDAFINDTIVGKGGGNISTNQAFGGNALVANTTGSDNSSFGRDALAANTTGSQNSAFGSGALSASVSVNGNSAFGYRACRVTTGAGNSAFGSQSLLSLTSGIRNTAIGLNALVFITTQSDNTALGHEAGRQIAAGGNLTNLSNSVLIGRDTRPNANGDTNEIVIGYQARGAGSNTVTIGNSSIILTILRGTVNMAGLPTSSAGLNTGDVWNNGGVLNIV